MTWHLVAASFALLIMLINKSVMSSTLFEWCRCVKSVKLANRQHNLQDKLKAEKVEEMATSAAVVQQVSELRADSADHTAKMERVRHDVELEVAGYKVSSEREKGERVN